MKSILILVTLAAGSSMAAAQTQFPAVQRRPRVDPQIPAANFVRAIEEFQAAYAQHGPIRNGVELETLNIELDESVVWYLQGRQELDIQRLHRLTNSLLKPPPAPAEVLARALQVAIQPPVFALTPPKSAQAPSDDVRPAPVAKLYSLYPLSWTVQDGGGKPLELKLRLRSPAGAVLETKSFAIQPGDAPAAFASSVELPVPPADSPCGVWTVEIVGPFERPITAARWPVVPRSLEEFKEESRAKLGAISTGDAFVKDAIMSCLARIARLSDIPSQSESSQFFVDPCKRMEELTQEIAGILKGKDIYKRRAGDLWRVVQVGDKRQVELRVFAPPAAAEGATLPLVIALPGFGGDENSFFEYYADGELITLAEALGFIVASPRMEIHGQPFVLSLFDHVVAALGDDYNIDAARIYVLGVGPTGGGKASVLARFRADRIAAVACIAGGDLSPGGTPCTGLILGGPVDAWEPAEKLAKKAQKAQSFFPSVGIEYRSLDYHGSWLAVGSGIDIAVPWLLERKR